MRKVSLSDLIKHNYTIVSKDAKYFIKQQDNQLFRQIRLTTNDKRDYNKWIVFVECTDGRQRTDCIDYIVRNGFYFNSQHFVISERSASMVRGGILSFIDARISAEVSKRISMGINFDKTVLSKYYAYRGLMLSSCHCFEGWYPTIVVVPDYYTTIKDQHIKFVYDKKTEIKKEDGSTFTWKQKDIDKTVKDIEINAFDGCGIHHPAITDKMQEMLNSKTRPTSVIWRAPYIKGLTFEMSYEEYFEELGIKTIKDIWGNEYSVEKGAEPLIIMCESMYKGLKYFKHYGDKRDWDNYWHQFKKYNHCLGIAKWNFSRDEEPIYTRANYQILQDLDLDYKDFALLVGKSIEWIQNIIDDDEFYTYCFLGMYADSCKASNKYVEAILKNPAMLKEYGVRKYIISLLNKYIDNMKCGKLWIKSCFKFLAPDLIMLMQHIAGIENPQGILAYDEFFTTDKNGIYNGEYLIERNPHICKSEHTILRAVENETLKKYCSHLANVAMINCKSITPQRLNGADYPLKVPYCSNVIWKTV